MLEATARQAVRIGTAKRSGQGLIHKKTFRPPQVDELNEHRRERYRRRAVAQRREIRHAREVAGLDPNTDDGYVRLSSRFWCGTPRRFGGGSVGINVAEYEGERRAHFSGVQHCGNVWTCPVCSGYVRHQRAEEIAEGARIHTEAGGGLAMVTFTVCHDRSMGLRDSFDVLRDAYSSMAATRAFKSWRAKTGYIGNVMAQEVTFGKNGWHPHRHSLFFFDSPVDADRAAEMEGELFSMWSRAVERVGGHAVSREAFDVRPVLRGESTLAGYITKVERGIDGIGKEIAISDVKTGRIVGSIAPLQLLDVESPEAERLWDEYADVTRGRSAIRWSRGLRARLGMGKERTDEEIANELEKFGTSVAQVSPGLFRERIGRRYEVACRLLEAVERGDFEEVAGIIGGRPREVTLADGQRLLMFEPVPIPLHECVGSERAA